MIPFVGMGRRQAQYAGGDYDNRAGAHHIDAIRGVRGAGYCHLRLSRVCLAKRGRILSLVRER